jgi:hypothetical protein
MKPQISYSYPVKVWLLTVLLSPYIAQACSEIVYHHRISLMSFEWAMMVLAGAIISIPAMGLLFSFFCYLTPEIRCAQTLRVTTILFGVALFLLTCFVLGLSMRELLDSEIWHFLLAYLAVMIVAGSLVYIERADGESTPYV